MDCVDGVAAVADEEVEEVELLELFVELLDEVSTTSSLVAFDFVALVPELVVLDATDDVVCVDAAITPVSASIPATLAAPTTTARPPGGVRAAPLPGAGRGGGSSGLRGLGRLVAHGSELLSGLAPGVGPGGVSFWFR